MKKTTLLIVSIFLAFISITAQPKNGRFYDECNDNSNVTWIGNMKVIWDDPWNQRQGDIYRFVLEDKNNYSFIVYEMPEGKTVKSILVDFYSPSGLIPTMAVKNAIGAETKYIKEWDNGFPVETDLGHNIKRHYLNIDIPEDAVQACIYLDGGSDVEIMRIVVEYGDGYTAPEYNDATDFSRVKKLLSKVESGKNITIGVIGGSITAGANAEPMATNCYGARLKAWFENTYGIQVELVNAGIGSTNSYYGAIRAEDHLLRFNPDLIVLEYACNDQDEDIYSHTYEGLLRKLLKAPGYPAIISSMLCTQAGFTKQDRQLPIAQYYNIPISSYNDIIKNEIINGEKSWLDYYGTTTNINGDGVHPNNAAHQKIANLISGLLTSVTADASVQLLTELPVPLNSNILEDAFILTENNISPQKIGNWTDGDNNKWFLIGPGGKGWRSNTANNELIFDFIGDVVAVTYWKRPSNENHGKAEIWVDNNQKVIVNSNGDHIDQLIFSNLGNGEHKLHINVLEDKYFEISSIAISGDREFFNSIHNIQSYSNKKEISINGNNIILKQQGDAIDINRTTDGYLTFKIDGKYISVNETDNSIELLNTITDAAKFLFVDKGKAFAFRSFINGKYLSIQEGFKASANNVTENELFLFTKADISNFECTTQNKLNIYGEKGSICIQNAAGKSVKVFSTDGKIHLNTILKNNFSSVDISQGIYMICIDNKTTKTVVY